MPLRDPLEFPKNSVDVLGDDGLFHHGRAVGQRDTGILVDFGIEKQEAQLIPFGRIYLCKQPTFMRDTRVKIKQGTEQRETERAVQVLMRVHATGPWKWLPATLLAADFDDFCCFGMVRVELEGKTIEGMIPADRIRGPRNSETLQELALRPESTEWQKNGEPTVALTKVDNTVEAFPGDGPQSLHLDILVEVFKYVDTVQQAKLRRVSVMWDSVITLPTVGRILSLRASWPLERYAIYNILTCLYSCFSDRTKAIIFDSGWPIVSIDADSGNSLVQTLKLGKEGNAGKTCVLANVTTGIEILAEEEGGSNWLGQLWGCLERLLLLFPVALGCNKLLIKNCDFLLYRFWNVNDGPGSSGRITENGSHLMMRITRGNIDLMKTTSLGDLWDKLNRNVPVLNSNAVVITWLADWIQETGSTDNTDLWDVVEILDVMQSSDSRDRIHYQHVKWFPIGLERITDVEVTKLTPLTQYCLLLRYICRSIRNWRIDVAW